MSLKMQSAAMQHKVCLVSYAVGVFMLTWCCAQTSCDLAEAVPQYSTARGLT